MVDPERALIRLVKNKAVQVVLDAAGDAAAGSETTVDEIEGQVAFDRAEIIRLLKKLQDHGMGTFITGRGGNVSRMRWNVEPRTLGMLRESGAVTFREADTGEESASQDGGPSFIAHSFNLREGLPVSFELPSDLTTSEADRLARFIQSLPFT